MSAIRSIAIVRLGALGDVLHVLPALTALRRNFPDAHIAWIVETAAASILADHPDLDERLILPRKEWSADLKQPGEWGRILREAFAFRRELKKREFDLAFDFQGNLRSGVVTALTGARIRVGFGRKASREVNHLFHTIRVTPRSSVLHKIEKNLCLLKRLDLDLSDLQPKLAIRPEESEAMKEWLQDFGRPVVAFHPGVSKFGHIKKIPPGRIAAMADAILDRTGGSILLTWGPGEKELAQTIRDQTTHSEVRLAPKTKGLRHLAALFEQVDLVVGVDTGPIHLAGIVGAPVLGLYGPKDPRIYGPPGDKVQVVVTREEFSCLPCNLHSCPIQTSEGWSPCMTSLDPELVARAAEELLETHRVPT